MKISKMSATLIDHMGSDLSVVNAARVSFHKVSDEFKAGDEKLIKYLATHKHFSPFNHAFLSFRVKAPIFVARQMVKHKFLPWNEVSRRYVDEEPEFYIPDARARADNVKQGSKDEEVEGAESTLVGATDFGLKCYNGLLLQGVAPEVARSILPQNMMSEWIWSGTLGAFADMLRLRMDPHTQAESREIACMIFPQIEEHFPISINALLKD